MNFFIQRHQIQLEKSGIPERYWLSLYVKLSEQIFDAGSVFEIAIIDYSDSTKNAKDPPSKLFVSAKNGLTCESPDNIFLIDHAWIFDIECITRFFTEYPYAVKRICNIFGTDASEDMDKDIEYIQSEMWKYIQPYSEFYGPMVQRLTAWYLMDELGSAINHSDTPNFRAVPFFFEGDRLAYTLLYPIKDVKCHDEVTRDFIENMTNDPEIRRALLLPWFDSNFDDINFLQEEPDENYFLSGYVSEILPDDDQDIYSMKMNGGKIKVYSNQSIIYKHLTDSAFECVPEEEDADIIWSSKHIRDFKSLKEKSPHVLVNQFPYEYILTIKNLLAIVARRAANYDKRCDYETLDTYPSWLPTTFNMNTELLEFISYFKHREAKNLDNVWVCKPWNLARGLDIHVTKNLDQILRMPSTGPKIAQKYVSKPVLYNRPDVGLVKFDIRYIILLKSVNPLEVYTYSNFFLRFANLEFALDNLNEYEQHFTVMNYHQSTQLYHVKCADFILKWNEMYPNYQWQTYVEPKIFDIILELFEAATSVPPPKGIAPNSQSRAMYAIDIILEWKLREIQPLVLEVNFAPDTERACEYYPDFYNDIFKTLFLDIENPKTICKLTAK